jgi:hypothetical protein
MNGNGPAVALSDRAEDCLPAYPDFNRALADDALLDVLKHSAHQLGYGLPSSAAVADPGLAPP